MCKRKETLLVLINKSLPYIIGFSVGILLAIAVREFSEKNWSAITAISTVFLVFVAIVAAILQKSISNSMLSSDIILRLDERFNSKEIKKARKEIAVAILTKQTNDESTAYLLDFFSLLAILIRKQSLDWDIARRMFSKELCYYVKGLGSYIEKERKSDSEVYESVTIICEEFFNSANERFKKDCEDENKRNDFYVAESKL